MEILHYGVEERRGETHGKLRLLSGERTYVSRNGWELVETVQHHL